MDVYQLQTDVYFYNFWWIRILVYKTYEKLWCFFDQTYTCVCIYIYILESTYYILKSIAFIYLCILILWNRVDEDNMLRTVKKLQGKKRVCSKVLLHGTGK